MSRNSRALGTSVTLSKVINAGTIKATTAVDATSSIPVDNPRTLLAVLNLTDKSVVIYLSDNYAAIQAGTFQPVILLAAGQYWEDPGNYQGVVTAAYITGNQPTTGTVCFTEWL